MQRWWFLLIVVLLALPGLAQPELCDGGEPASGAKNGTLTGDGEGLFQVTMLVGNLTLEGEGDLLISGKAKFTVDGEMGTKEVIDAAQAAEFVGKRQAAKAGANAGKPPARSGYVIYRGFKGTLTLNDNRFTLAVKGTVTNILAYGLGTSLLVGEGKWASTIDGVDGKTEGAWQPKPEEPADPKARKALVTPTPIGQYKLVRKANPARPRPQAKHD